jgi:precorrin-6B methylase 2
MLALKQGSIVADIGCHEGYMTVKLSAAVGNNGRVLAVDVEQSKLDRLKGNLQKREISNVEMVKGEFGDPHLPSNSLDAVIILDTYHEMDEHDAILQHVWTALRPGGRLVICEPIAEARKKSAREEQERKHELGMSFAIEDLKRAGFTILRQQDPFVDRTKEKGDTMWLIVAIK